MKSKALVAANTIENNIYLVRGQRVMLDSDLAVLYGIAVKTLNRAVTRNISRFPKDFAFYLHKNEWQILKYQIGTSKSENGGKNKQPRVFTEYGAYAAAFVLRSPRAQVMSIEVIRAFIRMRDYLASHKELGKDIQELKSFVLKHSQKTDQEFRKVWQTIEKLATPQTSERKIGFPLD